MQKNYNVPLVGTPKDYSNKENWMIFENKNKDVDLFFLYPTSVSPKCTELVSEVDDVMKHQANINYLKNGYGFSSYTNVYAPYYRQITGVGILQAMSPDGLMELCQTNVTRTDVYAALDYYFENINNGRPFIFASHSQGSCMMKLILSEYMIVHPEYYDRMIACYAIGYYFPDSWFKSNPHVKKANGETDTGVVITWNTEKPNCHKNNLPIGDGKERIFVINPLNWKVDETPASILENKGSIEVDDKLNIKIVKGKADATIDLKRGVIICTTSNEYLPDNPLFGEGSFHMEDCSLFQENIKENGKKRIETYFNNQKKIV